MPKPSYPQSERANEVPTWALRRLWGKIFCQTLRLREFEGYWFLSRNSGMYMGSIFFSWSHFFHNPKSRWPQYTHNFRMVQIKLFLLFAVATIAPVLAHVHPLARCVSSSFVLLLITRYLLQAILSSREDTNLLGSAFSRRFFNGDRVVL